MRGSPPTTGGPDSEGRTIPLCPNCREKNGCYEHEGDIFECIHCDQLFTFNPIGRRLPDDAIEVFIRLHRPKVCEHPPIFVGPDDVCKACGETVLRP